MVNDTLITKPDNFAANGVLHRTESFILPPDFKLLNSPEKVMLSLNASRFVSLLRQAGLAGNYTDTTGKGEKRTFLVPADDVLDATSDWERASGAFGEGVRLKETLQYHILPGRITPKHLLDGQLLPTELQLGKLGGDRQRLRVHVDSGKHQGGVDEQGTPTDIRFGMASVTAEPCETWCFSCRPDSSTKNESLQTMPMTTSSTWFRHSTTLPKMSFKPRYPISIFLRLWRPYLRLG